MARFVLHILQRIYLLTNERMLTPAFLFYNSGRTNAVKEKPSSKLVGQDPALCDLSPQKYRNAKLKGTLYA